MENTHDLMQTYLLKKNEIAQRLEEFSEVKEKGDGALLEELAFCICTANSSAAAAWKAQQKLAQTGLLYSDSKEKIAETLVSSGVRFHNHKAGYIIEARKKLFDEKKLAQYLSEHGEKTNQVELRNKLAKEVMGIGLKEAGHFLRNSGIASEIAILDRHILKNLQKYGAIEKMPKTLTPKNYFEIEQKMMKFSKKEGIPMAHLDLLFWSEQTGRIFK